MSASEWWWLIAAVVAGLAAVIEPELTKRTRGRVALGWAALCALAVGLLVLP